MQFINPSFLYALFAIAIPVSIHLFNFRRYKTVYFTNVRFLKEVQLETKSRSRLKHLLVLLARILAICALVFAFAQPYIPSDNKKIISGEEVVSVYIDNSFSMDAIGKGGRLLDEAKKLAAEIVGSHNQGARFQLLTNDFEGKHQHLVSKEEFLQLLEELKLSPAFRTIQEVLSRQADVLNASGSKNKTAFVISDFQKNMFSLTAAKIDTGIRINLLPLLAEERNNLSIDSCWFASPVRKRNQAEQLYVRIKNYSGRDYENIPVKLFINEQQKTPASFNIKANSQTDIMLSYTISESGIQNARIELNDFPVTFDDKLYFSYTVLKQIPILNIHGDASIQDALKSGMKGGVKEGSGSYLNSLFGKDSVVQLSNADEKHIDYSTLGSYSLIILNEMRSVSSGLAQELNKFVKNGGNLIVFPAEQSDLNSYKDFLGGFQTNFYELKDTLRTKVEQINYAADIYRDVFEKKTENIDLPVVFAHYIISKNSKSAGETLLKLQDGNSFLERAAYGKGQVYLFAVPLSSSWSNFARHAVFVPTLYQAALFSQPLYQLFYIIGSNELVEVNATATGDGIFKLNPASGKKLEIIPEHRIVDSGTTLFFHEQVKEPGNYILSRDKETLMGISFNFNRRESDLAVFTKTDLEKLIGSAGWSNFRIIDGNNQNMNKLLSEIDEGKKLWKLCIILALLFFSSGDYFAQDKMNVLIKSAKVIDPGSPFNGKTIDLLIEDGFIHSIEKTISRKGVQTVESENLHVSPGWFDMQVNLCDPGFEYKEDLHSGTQAAAFGGFTAVACLPSTRPPIHTKSEVEYVINKVKGMRKNSVDVFPIGALSYDLKGKDIAELYDMHLSGAVAFTDGKNTDSNAGLLLRGLLYTKNFNGLVLTFCDERSISMGGLMNEGPASTMLGLKGIPALAEELMIARTIYIAEYAECRVHIASVSTAKSVDLIRKAKSKKINITASVNAYSLTLEDTLLKTFETNYKVSPPLRSKADMDALKKGLIDGTLDCITSDHSPENIENKLIEFEHAANGIIGLETMYALVNTRFGKSLSPESLIEKIAINPRKLFSLSVPAINKKEKANLTIFDPTLDWTFQDKHIHSQSKNTPLLGTKFTGKALGIYNNKVLTLAN